MVLGIFPNYHLFKIDIILFLCYNYRIQNFLWWVYLMNNIIINFTYRNKFEKLITSNEERQIFTAAFNNFFGLAPNKACHFLWELTFNANVARKALQEIGLNSENMSSEMILSIRNELRHQYNQLRPGFLEVSGIPDECQIAFKALKKRTDDIVANVVYHHCTYRLDEDELYMNNLFALLSSDKDNKYFGGISSLYFGRLEADYLKPLHSLIHDLLKEMYAHHQKQTFVSQPLNAPFAELDKMLQEKGFEIPFNLAETPAEVQEEIPGKVPADSVFKAITLENILDHKDVFSAFVINHDMNSLSELSNLGFDLNQVVSKEKAIFKLLKAVEARDAAAKALAKATQMKEEADATLLEATKALS